MRIADKIASRVLQKLEEYNIVPPKKDYLDVECAIADAIADEFQRWLKYDVDLLDFTELERCPKCGNGQTGCTCKDKEGKE